MPEGSHLISEEFYEDEFGRKWHVERFGFDDGIVIAERATRVIENL